MKKPTSIDREVREFPGILGGKIKVSKAQRGIVQFSTFYAEFTHTHNTKIVFKGRLALDCEGYSELMIDHADSVICEILHPLGLHMPTEEKISQLLTEIKAATINTGWEHFDSYLLKLRNECDEEKDTNAFIVASWAQLYEEPFQQVWLAAMAKHALYFESNDYAVGYLVALIDQKKNSEHHFLRGKGTLDSAKLGGLAKSATTKAKTNRTMTELLRLVSTGHSVSRASELAFKNGYGSSTMANKKIWSRNFKK